MLHLDGWYRYILMKTAKVPMKIKTEVYNPLDFFKLDEFGDVIEKINPIEIIEPVLDYDFFTDEIIEQRRMINPLEMIPEEGLRYSIINIIAYVLSNLANDIMEDYSRHSNSYVEGKKCLMSMKNEFLFKRMMLTLVKKHYATIQELQEGNIVPKDKALDIKGLEIKKSGLNKATQDALEKILYEDILTSKIDQIKLIKDLAILEKKIYKSLASGEKDYYKPSSIKPMQAYDMPFRQMGIKASVVWNELLLPGYEKIDLEKKNVVDIVKVKLNLKTVIDLKSIDEDMYNRAVLLLNRPEIKGEINAIAIPQNQSVPAWIFEFINYTELINNNLGSFPIESLNIVMKKGTSNYTNIVQI